MAAKIKKCAKCGAIREGKLCGNCGYQEKRGGHPNSGRGKGRSQKIAAALDTDTGRQFAARVFKRIEDGIPDEIKSPEDYVLNLLFDRDVQTRSYVFHRLLDRRYGPPAKIIEVGGRDGQPIPLNLSGDVFERLNATVEQLRERLAKRPAPWVNRRLSFMPSGVPVE